MSTETTTPRSPSNTRRRLTTLAVAAGGLLVMAVALTLERREPPEPRPPEPDPFGQVRGVVTLDGQPLGTVEVAFLPDPALGTRGATANCYTDDQGRYALRTEREDRAGALVGHHRVVIHDIAALPSPGGLPGTDARAPAGPPKQNRVPPAYADPYRTPFRIEVKPGAQTVNLDLVTPQPESESKP
jgi:hypothetical protein